MFNGFIAASDWRIGDSLILDAILAFAAVVIVPLGLRLTRGRVPPLTYVAATLFTAGLLLPGDIRSAALAVPWLLNAFIHLASAAFAARDQAQVRSRDQAPAWSRTPRTAAIGEIAALAFLVIGAGWSVLACGGWSVLGFDPVIVQLTAIHFHYAGFALTILATKAAQGFPGRLAGASMTFILAGVPAVAAGISLRSIAIEWWATVLLTSGCCLVALLQFRAALAAKAPIARTLLMISAMSLLTGMGLAVAYAAARQFSLTSLDIPTMIRTHGQIQSLGFAFLGLLAWRTLTRSVSEDSPQPQPPASSLTPYNSA